jgi:hypothetical protein
VILKIACCVGSDVRLAHANPDDEMNDGILMDRNEVSLSSNVLLLNFNNGYCRCLL